MRRILYVSDGKGTKEAAFGNSHQGLSFYHCERFSTAFADIQRIKPDAVIIDSDRQELAALELCYIIKSDSGFRQLKTIVLSSSTEPESEIASFQAGADDFVTKPLRNAAFLYRLSKRLGIGGDTIALQSSVNTNKLHIDKGAYSVFLNQQLIQLSRKEFELLYLLASQPAKVFTREEIFEKVWLREGEEKDRTIDVHVLRLRKKLGDDFIQTQKGVGYRLVV